MIKASHRIHKRVVLQDFGYPKLSTDFGAHHNGTAYDVVSMSKQLKRADASLGNKILEQGLQGKTHPSLNNAHHRKENKPGGI